MPVRTALLRREGLPHATQQRFVVSYLRGLLTYNRTRKHLENWSLALRHGQRTHLNVALVVRNHLLEKHTITAYLHRHHGLHVRLLCPREPGIKRSCACAAAARAANASSAGETYLFILNAFLLDSEHVPWRVVGGRDYAWGAKVASKAASLVIAGEGAPANLLCLGLTAS